MTVEGILGFQFCVATVLITVESRPLMMSYHMNAFKHDGAVVL